MALGYVAGVGGGGGGQRRIPNITQQGTQVYNGQLQSPTWFNYNADTVDIVDDPGDQKEAGEYRVGFRPKTKYCWEDNKGTEVRYVTWRISPCLIATPVITTKNFTFDKNDHTPSVSYDTKISDYGDSPEDVFNIVNLSGRDAQNYTTSWTIKSNNYTWAVATPTTKTDTWTINKLKLVKPTINGNSSLDLKLNSSGSWRVTNTTKYDAISQSITVNNPSTAYLTQSGDTSGKYAKEYSVTYTIDEPTNVCWEDNTTNAVTLNWEIKGIVLAPFNYTPVELTFNAKADSIDESSSENSITKLIQDQYTNVGPMNFELTGTYKYNDGDHHQYSNVKNTAATNICGTYIAYLQPYSGYFNKDDHPSDITWQGGAKSVELSWTIKPNSAPGTKPSLTTSSVVFSGDQFMLKNYFNTSEVQDNRTYILIYVNDVELSELGKVKSSGDYNIKLKPVVNYCWSDNTTDEVSCTFTVEKHVVKTPQTTAFTYTYDGTTSYKLENLIPFDNSWYKEGNPNNAKLVSTGAATTWGKSVQEVKDSISSHPLSIIAAYKDDVVWSSTMTNENVSTSLTITQARVPKVTLNQSTYYYDGTEIFPSISNDTHPLVVKRTAGSYLSNGINNLRCQHSGVRVGSYTTGYYLHLRSSNSSDYSGSDIDKQNRAWSDGTYQPVLLMWQIVPNYNGKANHVYERDMTISLSTSNNTDLCRYIYVFFNNNNDINTRNITVSVNNSDILSVNSGTSTASNASAGSFPKQAYVKMKPLTKGSTKVTLVVKSPSASNQTNTYEITVTVVD